MGRLKDAPADAKRATALAIELVSKPPVQPDDYLVATVEEVISGRVHLASRDSATALADYRRGVEYQRHLMEANPNTEARYSYAVVLEAAGNAMALRGDFAGALDTFHEEEKIVDILLRDNPFDVRRLRIRMASTRTSALSSALERPPASCRGTRVSSIFARCVRGQRNCIAPIPTIKTRSSISRILF
jgi:hypothetical protein